MRRSPRRSVYLKFRDRQSYEFALASVAAAMRIARRHGRRGAAGARRSRHQAVARPARRGCPARPADQPASFAAAAREELAAATPQPMNAFKVELAQRAIVRALNTLTDGDR